MTKSFDPNINHYEGVEIGSILISSAFYKNWVFAECNSKYSGTHPKIEGKDGQITRCHLIRIHLPLQNIRLSRLVNKGLGHLSPMQKYAAIPMFSIKRTMGTYFRMLLGLSFEKSIGMFHSFLWSVSTAYTGNRLI